MQVLEGAEELCGVEPTAVFVELALSLEMEEQLATVHCASVLSVMHFSRVLDGILPKDMTR